MGYEKLAQQIVGKNPIQTFPVVWDAEFPSIYTRLGCVEYNSLFLIHYRHRVGRENTFLLRMTKVSGKCFMAVNSSAIDFFDKRGQFLPVFFQNCFYMAAASGPGSCVEAIFHEYIF